MGTAEQSAVPSYDFSKVKLYIALPTRGQSSMNFSMSMALSCYALGHAKANLKIAIASNGCFVDMNRNRLLADFMQSDCTHIWMADDDMGWDWKAPLSMLAKDVPFIAGIGPLKTDSGEDWAVRLNTDAEGYTKGRDGLMSASYVGGAFLILKREVVERMIAAYPDLKCPSVDERTGYRFFEYDIKTPKGEDFVFCERWTAIGGEIWCYPNISFTHSGNKDFKGNYHEYRLAKVGAEVKAVEPKRVGHISEHLEKLLHSEPFMEQIVKRLCELKIFALAKPEGLRILT